MMNFLVKKSPGEKKPSAFASTNKEKRKEPELTESSTESPSKSSPVKKKTKVANSANSPNENNKAQQATVETVDMTLDDR